MARTNISKIKARTLLKEFTKNITFYKMDDILDEYIEKAHKIVENIDPDDYPFVALHLEQGNKIWTCDIKLINGLLEEGYNICITTEELRAKTYKKLSK